MNDYERTRRSRTDQRSEREAHGEVRGERSEIENEQQTSVTMGVRWLRLRHPVALAAICSTRE